MKRNDISQLKTGADRIRVQTLANLESYAREIAVYRKIQKWPVADDQEPCANGIYCVW